MSVLMQTLNLIALAFLFSIQTCDNYDLVIKTHMNNMVRA